MPTIRRLYLYAVAFVSLETVLWGAIRLTRALLSGEALANRASSLAGPLSLILVGAPVFFFHWRLAQQSAARDPEERFARTRAVFLSGIRLATWIPVVQNTLALVNRAWLAAFGLDPLQAVIGGNQSWSDNLAAILINSAAAGFTLYILRADWQAGPQGEDYEEVRRLDRYLWLVYALAMVIGGVQQSLQFILSVWEAADLSLQPQLANGLSFLLVGAPLWLFVDRLIRQALIDPNEEQSLLRLIVLYTISITSISGMLISIGMIIDVILRAVLGENIALSGYLAQISIPVSFALPLGAVWAYYGRDLRAAIQDRPISDAGPPPATGAAPRGRFTPRRAALRRLYFYILALFGLGAAFGGLHSLLGQVIDTLIGQAALLSNPTREPFAAAASMLLVGLPLWVLAWRPVAAAAALEGEPGEHSRRSVVRKGYLFLILFAGVIGIMFSAGRLLYQLLNDLLGGTSSDLLLESLQQIKTLLLLAVVTAFHWRTLRIDGQRAERTLTRRHAQFPVLILAPENEAFIDQMVDALRRTAAGLPVAIHRYSQGAPDETLSAARVVILPSELASRPSEAIRLWLQGFTGVRLVVSTPTKDWYWISGSGRSLPTLARQTAAMVRRLAEGEELPQQRDSSTWLAFVYILAGLFALQVLLALTGLALSLLFQ